MVARINRLYLMMLLNDKASIISCIIFKKIKFSIVFLFYILLVLLHHNDS